MPTVEQTSLEFWPSIFLVRSPAWGKLLVTRTLYTVQLFLIVVHKLFMTVFSKALTVEQMECLQDGGFYSYVYKDFAGSTLILTETT